jgi:hypothetical protein
MREIEQLNRRNEADIQKEKEAKARKEVICPFFAK